MYVKRRTLFYTKLSSVPQREDEKPFFYIDSAFPIVVCMHNVHTNAFLRILHLRSVKDTVELPDYER